DFSKAGPVGVEGLGLLAFALGGAGLILREHRGAVLTHPLHGVLLPPLVVVSVALLLPWTPAVYEHAWLPIFPIAAVYTGLALAAVAEWGRRGGTRRTGLAVLAFAAVLLPLAGGTLHDALRDHTTEQFRVMRLLLMHACPGEPVLDGTALAVFRPAAYRYGVLMT